MRTPPVKGKYTFGYLFGVPTSYSDFHLGIDYVQPKGKPVYAVEDGKIVYSGVGTQGGKTLHLKGKSGALTRYLHLDTFSVLQGSTVLLGQQIGTIGTTGSLSTGPHLHFDVWTTGKIDLKTRKGLVDPLIWLKEGDDMVTIDNTRAIVYRIYKKWLKIMNPAPADIEAQATYMANYLNKSDEEAADKQFADFEAGAPEGSGLPSELTINTTKYRKV